MNSWFLRWIPEEIPGHMHARFSNGMFRAIPQKIPGGLFEEWSERFVQVIFATFSNDSIERTYGRIYQRISE